MPPSPTPTSPTTSPPPPPCDRVRTASETDPDGGATLPSPCVWPPACPPGFSNASLGCSSGWICGGGGACTALVDGNFGPPSAVSIFCGRGSASGRRGVDAGNG